MGNCCARNAGSGCKRAEYEEIIPNPPAPVPPIPIGNITPQSPAPPVTNAPIIPQSSSTDIIQAGYIAVNCGACNKRFNRKTEDTWRKYCSKVCSDSMLTRAQCRRCNIQFRRAPGDESWRQCCSERCSKLLIISKTCERCAKLFDVTFEQRHRKYCFRSECFVERTPVAGNENRFTTAYKPYSEKAIVWLEQISQRQQIYIRHAKNDGEYSTIINGRRVYFDGYDPATHTVYEFYGDYWHGHPSRFPPDNLHPKTGTTYGELYQKTLDREDLIRSAGYKLVTIWEHEYDRA